MKTLAGIRECSRPALLKCLSKGNGNAEGDLDLTKELAEAMRRTESMWTRILELS